MNEQIEQLEIQLENMSIGKKLLIYVIIIGCTIFFGWNLFGEELNQEIDLKNESIISLNSKLQKNSIKSFTRAIKNTKKEILSLEERYDNLKFKKQFLQSNLEDLNFINYNQEGIAQLLDDILKNSMKNEIDIDSIKYKDTQINFAIHIMEKEQLNVIGSGTFKGIISLVQYIDSLSALLRVKGIHIAIDKDKTNFDLNISHYGVEL